MKRLIATSAFLLVGIAGFSQPGPERPKVTAEQIAQRQANALSERLSLSEDQRTKAYNVYLDAAKKNIAEREARMKEMQKQREAADADHKQQSDKISRLLNADQKKTFQEMQERRKEMGPGQDLGFRRGPGTDRFQRPGAPGQRFQTRPDGQNQQFQRPGAPGQRFQARPDGQNNRFRREGLMPRTFRDRAGRPDVLRQRDSRSQNFRHRLYKRFKRAELQKRIQRPAPKADQPEAAPAK